MERSIRKPDGVDLTKCPVFKSRPDICCGACHHYNVESQKTGDEWVSLPPVTMSGYWLTTLIYLGEDNKLIYDTVSKTCKHPEIVKKRG